MNNVVLDNIKQSFTKVKGDINSNSNAIHALTNVVDDLRRENIMLKNMILEMQEKMGKTQQHIEAPVDMKAMIKETLEEFEQYQPKEEAAETKPAQNEIDMMNINKKDIIKSKIIETVEYNDVTLPRLKEVIVDVNKYCSRASFYRYFDELKKEGKVNVVNVDNNQIVRVMASVIA